MAWTVTIEPTVGSGSKIAKSFTAVYTKTNTTFAGNPFTFERRGEPATADSLAHMYKLAKRERDAEAGRRIRKTTWEAAAASVFAEA